MLERTAAEAAGSDHDRVVALVIHGEDLCLGLVSVASLLDRQVYTKLTRRIISSRLHEWLRIASINSSLFILLRPAIFSSFALL
jgi:hypothetical protein